jgi:hypothetical protein
MKNKNWATFGKNVVRAARQYWYENMFVDRYSILAERIHWAELQVASKLLLF